MSDKEIEKPEEIHDEMGFMDHLAELRKRIIWAVVGIILGCIISGVFIDFFMEQILIAPASVASLTLQNLKPFGQPVLYFKVVLVLGIILSFPFSLYQIWKFIAPGLYNTEKSWVRRITFFTSLCFFTGVMFAYFVMMPVMLSFSASFGSSEIKNIIDINEYFSFITTLLLASGIIFELPMITWVLSRIGLLTPQFMRKYRRHAIIVILIIAAILTPTPDPFNQLTFAIPLYILYEISILISKSASKKYRNA